MNPTLLMILGGGAILYWLSTRDKPAGTTPATSPSQTPARPSATPATPATPAPQPGNVSTTPVPPVSALDSLRNALLADLAGDPEVTSQAREVYAGRTTLIRPQATFSVFNWHLANVGRLSDLPDYYGASGGHTDPNVPIPFEDYWAIMAPWLRANRGLSGIGAYGPAYMPAYRSRYLGPGGWRA